ncbi:hypothetical protein [Luteipulveratus halotolerans]|uniref:Uncharacterized protein n=1 Tax=Luteipulveratus halotolerans TaxID=1631356 RepID=A0A0L6CPM6_9MICO|nr:hypothetical protein [Luteipulveratus halotolerans]KNX39697.1 hypothetical protein VV01_00225 [Luteipulveratus halotolerans]
MSINALTTNHLAAAAPAAPNPTPVDLPEVTGGLDTLLGILATIGPYAFLGGIMLGAIWLVAGMFGHGELKGAKFIFIAIVAAIIFGAAGSVLSLFTDY